MEKNIVRSLHPVDLPDETYIGLWEGCLLIIPFDIEDVEEHVEIIVSESSPILKKVKVAIKNKKATFEM